MSKNLIKEARKLINKETLTAKQKLFCKYYAETGNAQKSARLAGYSAKDLSRGNRLLKMQKIKEEIKRIKEMPTNAVENEMTKEYILAKLKSKIEDPTVPHRDQLKALEILGKLQGLFTDKVEHEITNHIKYYLPYKENEEKNETDTTVKTPEHSPETISNKKMTDNTSEGKKTSKNASILILPKREAG